MSLPLFEVRSIPDSPHSLTREPVRSLLLSIPTCEVCGIIPTHHFSAYIDQTRPLGFCC